MLRRLRHRLGFHSWRYVFGDLLDRYLECRICGLRKLERNPEFQTYRPIAQWWLDGEASPPKTRGYALLGQRQ